MAERARPRRDPGEAPAELDFDALFRAHFHEVQRWVHYLGAPAADVDDLTQRIFQIVLERRGDFRGGEARPWLYGIARRVVAGHRRKVWLRRVLFRAPEELELFASTAADAETLARLRRVQALVLQLSEKLRTVFILAQIEGLTLDEIARLQRISPNTAASRLRLARQRFAELSRDPEDSDG